MRISARLIAFLLCTFAAMLLVPAAFSQTTPAQQPRVLAPHKPVSPALPRAKTWNKPAVLQSVVGGLWMIGANFKSSLYLRNDVKTQARGLLNRDSCLGASCGSNHTASRLSRLRLRF